MDCWKGQYQQRSKQKQHKKKNNYKLKYWAAIIENGDLEIATVNSNIKRNIRGVTTDDATEFPLTVTFTSTGNSYIVDADGNVDTYKLANTTWQDNVNYVLDEQNKTLTLVRNDTSRTDIYNGAVIIKEKAVIDEVEYTTKFPNDCSYLFEQASRMTSFSMDNIDTSNVTSMRFMFLACTSLQTIDVSNLNTSNVGSMQQMFYYCTSLQTLDLSSFNVEKVQNMAGMFDSVNAKLILTGWKIKENNVINSTSGGWTMLFSGCESSEIIANNWNVSNVNNLTGVFNRLFYFRNFRYFGVDFRNGVRCTRLFRRMYFFIDDNRN